MKKSTKKMMLVLTVLLAVIVFAACGGNNNPTPQETAPPPVSTPVPTPVAEPQTVVQQNEPIALTPAQIFENNKYAVFQIVAWDGQMGWFGSGFFVDSNGTAVTNHHVMVDAVEAYALLYDGREIPITGFFSYDIGNDLAVVQVGSGNEGFSYVTLGDSEAARVGETVFAVGGPEGDPITFTDGMISRFANEPISFGIYTIAGMLQSTAAIYGGNSGGPLLNDRGHVIGINSAGRPDRPSAQWAVPSNRIAMPTSGAGVSQLPIGGIPWVEGQVTYMALFPFIPDLASVSRNVTLRMSGTPVDLGETSGLFYELYAYLIIYHIPEEHWIPDTDLYDIVLQERGFIMQNVVHWEGETWVYFYHPGLDVSLSYVYFWEFDSLLVGLVDGDIYTEFYHGGQAQGASPQLVLDPTLFGVWEFVYTTDAGYIAWDAAGEYLFYIFEADGTGQFITLNAAGNLVREFNFHWAIAGGEVIIEYTDFNLVLVYAYGYDAQHGTLHLLSVENEHLLVFVED